MASAPLANLVDLENLSVWKAGAGDGNRLYADELIRHDVFAAGPGEPGPYRTGEKYLFDGADKHYIRHFYEDARPGDLFILRSGVWTVHGIGVVQDGHAEYDEAWGDLDGWDLRHVR